MVTACIYLTEADFFVVHNKVICNRSSLPEIKSSELFNFWVWTLLTGINDLSRELYKNCLQGSREGRGSLTVPEELTLDYMEVKAIPPLPLWLLLEADKESQHQTKSNDVKEDVSNNYQLNNYLDNCILMFRDQDIFSSGGRVLLKSFPKGYSHC